MASFSNLSDRQNMLLTQLSYSSGRFSSSQVGMTLEEIYVDLYGEPVPQVSDAHSSPSDLQENFQSMLAEMIALDMGDLTLKATGNDAASGFGAVALTDSEGKTGFAFRGTDGVSLDSMNDWADNADAALTGTSVQTAQSESFFDQYKDVDGGNYLYGHSKGGQLSQSVLVNNSDDVASIHLLNPQPLNPYALTAEQLQTLNSEKVDILVVEGDYVWFLGKVPNISRIRVVKKVEGTNSHLYDSIDWNGSQIRQGSQPAWEFAVMAAIDTGTTGLQITGGVIGRMYNEIVQLVDSVQTDGWLQPDELVEKIGKIISPGYSIGENLGSKLREYLQRKSNKEYSSITGSSGNAHSGGGRRISSHSGSGFSGGGGKSSGGGSSRSFDSSDDVQSGYVRGKTEKEGVNTVTNSGSGSRQSGSLGSSEIKVNTATLRGYADRLDKVVTRLNNLESRMDQFYAKYPQNSLKKVATANSISAQVSRISNCSKYLTETAADFESVERNVTSMF